MSLFLLLISIIIPVYKTSSFYERQHKEFLTLDTEQVSSLPHIDNEIQGWPIIKYSDLSNAKDSYHFNRLDHDIANKVSHATLSIITIYKNLIGKNLNEKHELYPYQIGSCTLVKDPYPDDPRISALEKNIRFDEEYFAAMGLHLPEGDILIKSLNCITNYHIVRPYIRFYANTNESSVCSSPLKQDPDCYQLKKIYITNHPGLFLEIYYANNNARKKELFINNDYKRIHKYFYIAPASVVQYPKLSGKAQQYYLNMNEQESEIFDVAIVNFEECRGEFDMKFMIDKSLAICDKDYPGWIMKMKIFIIGYPTVTMTTSDAKLLKKKGVWNDKGIKYISSGEFDKMVDNMGIYALNVNAANAGGVISHFVIQPGYNLCVNMIHSNGQHGIKINMTYLHSIGLAGGFRIPVDPKIISDIAEKQQKKRNKFNKNEL